MEAAQLPQIKKNETNCSRLVFASVLDQQQKTNTLDILTDDIQKFMQCVHSRTTLGKVNFAL